MRVESAPADAKRYANLAFGTHARVRVAVRRCRTPGMQLRDAGAKGRAMHVGCGRRRTGRFRLLSLPSTKSVVYHAASQRQAGQFLVRWPKTASCRCRCPTRSALKDPKDFKPHRAAIDAPGGCAWRRSTARHSSRWISKLPGHAGGAAAAAAAIRRRPSRVLDRCQRGDRRFRASSRWSTVPGGVAVVAKGFLGGETRTRRASSFNWDDTHAEKRGSAAIDG